MNEHVCGLQGFGRGFDGRNDTCPACEEREARYQASRAPAAPPVTETPENGFAERFATLQRYCARRDIPNEWKLRDALHLLGDVLEHLDHRSAPDAG